MYRRGLVVGAALAIALPSCGGNGGETIETQPRAGMERNAVPPNLSGPARAKIIARLSREARGQNTVPSEFCRYDDVNPQPMYGQHPARLIVNSLCQPPLGAPVSVHREANFGSDKVGEVTDGEVVEALCVTTDGQSTTNVLGPQSASTTWVRVAPGMAEGFVSEVNLGYVDDSQFDEC